MMDRATRNGKKFWASLAFTAIVCALLVGLGAWQLQRLSWKTQLIDALADKDVPAVMLPTEDVSAFNPQPTLFFGRYRPENTILVRSGDHFMVYMPFQTEDGWMVLMRRGSIPAQDIGGLVLDEKSSAGPVSVTGIPVPRPNSIPFIREPAPQSLLWTLLDWKALEDKMKVYTLAPRLAPYIVTILEEPEGPLPLTPSPPVLRNDHLQYAIFWFGMAIIAALLFGRFLLFPPRGKQV